MRTQASMDEVIRALQRSGLPFGAKAAVPQPITAYPFFHDPKKTKVLWDVRKVSAGACVDAGSPSTAAQRTSPRGQRFLPIRGPSKQMPCATQLQAWG